MKKLGIYVTDDGVIIDANGFIGKECVVETEKILAELEKLGIEIDINEVKLKKEYYQQSEEHTTEVNV